MFKIVATLCLPTAVSFVWECRYCRTLPSFATEDCARWHCSCFKFELESFHFPRRLIGLYLPSLQTLFCNSAVAVSRCVASAAAAARSVAVTNTTRIFEILLGLSLAPVQGRKPGWNGSQKAPSNDKVKFCILLRIWACLCTLYIHQNMKWFDAGTKKMSVSTLGTFIKLINSCLCTLNVQCTKI